MLMLETIQVTAKKDTMTTAVTEKNIFDLKFKLRSMVSLLTPMMIGFARTIPVVPSDHLPYHNIKSRMKSDAIPGFGGLTARSRSAVPAFLSAVVRS
jgi:hypothetical protein